MGASGRRGKVPRDGRSGSCHGSLRHFSSHLPAVVQPDERLFETVLLAPQTNPFVGPDQAALEALLATFEPAGAT